MNHINYDDAQADQSLVWSCCPQMNFSGKQNQSQTRCEARDVSHAQADLSFRHSHVLQESLHVQPNSIQTILCDQSHFVDSS